MTQFDPRTTALVLIDLQNGIVQLPVVPYSGAEVLAAGRDLAKRFRAAGAPVVLVHVGFAPDFADAPKQLVDQPTPFPEGGLPAGWSDLCEGLAQPSDIVIFKRQWGAFHGTALDLQLRRRGVKTIVIGGISTNIGVESTVRAGWEHGYEMVVVEDACASNLSADLHNVAFQHIFPRISRIKKSAEIGFTTA
jgi:nicotinamidase-related amidase